MIDEEIRNLLRKAEEAARKCLSNNRESLDELARMLIESETLSDKDIRAALHIDSRSKDECCAAISV